MRWLLIERQKWDDYPFFRISPIGHFPLQPLQHVPSINSTQGVSVTYLENRICGRLQNFRVRYFKIRSNQNTHSLPPNFQYNTEAH